MFFSLINNLYQFFNIIIGYLYTQIYKKEPEASRRKRPLFKVFKVKPEALA